jgi:hypothetical protein
MMPLRGSTSISPSRRQPVNGLVHGGAADVEFGAQQTFAQHLAGLESQVMMRRLMAS